MPVPTGVISNALMPTGIALFHMATEGSGPTDFDRAHDATLGLRERQRRASADTVAHSGERYPPLPRKDAYWSLRLEVLWWRGWLRQWRWDWQQIKRTGRRTDGAGGDFEIAGGGG